MIDRIRLAIAALRGRPVCNHHASFSGVIKDNRVDGVLFGGAANTGRYTAGPDTIRLTTPGRKVRSVGQQEFLEALDAIQERDRELLERLAE